MPPPTMSLFQGEAPDLLRCLYTSLVHAVSTLTVEDRGGVCQQGRPALALGTARSTHTHHK